VQHVLKERVTLDMTSHNHRRDEVCRTTNLPDTTANAQPEPKPGEGRGTDGRPVTESGRAYVGSPRRKWQRFSEAVQTFASTYRRFAQAKCLIPLGEC
jgi:hypothetical protein